MLSIIVPAYNEEKTIGKTLKSLVDQKTDIKFEVIVVNNNSTDKTAKIAKTYQKSLPLRIVNEKIQGRGAAKARGAQESNGEILAYLDADTSAHPGWIDAIAKCFNDQNIVAATGPWEMTELPRKTKWFAEHFQETAQLPYRLVKGSFWLNGMNMAIKKKAYQESGGFNPGLNAHDDVDISNRLNKIGKINYCKDMKVTTSGRRYKNGFLSGLLTYQKTAVQYFWLGNMKANLEDRR